MRFWVSCILCIFKRQCLIAWNRRKYLFLPLHNVRRVTRNPSRRTKAPIHKILSLILTWSSSLPQVRRFIQNTQILPEQSPSIPAFDSLFTWSASWNGGEWSKIRQGIHKHLCIKYLHNLNLLTWSSSLLHTPVDKFFKAYQSIDYTAVNSAYTDIYAWTGIMHHHYSPEFQALSLLISKTIPSVSRCVETSASSKQYPIGSLVWNWVELSH
jgi:hypothetical protein